MRTRILKAIITIICLTALPLLAAGAQAQSAGTAPAAAQPTNAGTWRHFANPPQDPPAPNSAQNAPSNGPAPVVDAPPDPGQSNENQGNYQQQQPPIPAELTLKPGAFVPVRVNQALSSDRNQAGDGFTATLAQPLVVDGIVVAERGQTVGGRVVEAKKAGMVKGVSRLAVQLTSITLADGQPAPIQTQLTGSNGPTSNGRDAAAVATTTGVGSIIGASVSNPWNVGTGAAIGAGIGAAAGIVGVLLTRGEPTVIPPETLLTFQTTAPLTISTMRTPQAFRYVTPDDYQQANNSAGPTPQGPPPCSGYGCPPPYPYYAGPAYPYWWGPSVNFWWGPGYYWGPRYNGYYGRGYYGYYGRGYYGRAYYGHPYRH